MKILFVNNLPLADSESGVYTTNLAKDLTDNGHECAILFPENTVKYKKYGDIKLFPVFFSRQLNVSYVSLVISVIKDFELRIKFII